MKYTVITTFNREGYNQYGHKMIETFSQNWPKTVKLQIYAENCADQLRSFENIEIFDLELTCPKLVDFKNLWRGVPKANGDVSQDPVRSRRTDAGKGFKWDAIRFSHKVYAIFHAAKHCSSPWLIWMDADMVCHAPMPESFLDSMCPENIDLCFLGRRGKFSECGLYAMQLYTKGVNRFLKEFQRMYDEAESGIFTLGEWHDSFVFDDVRHRIDGLRQLDWSQGIITGEGHPLINSAWGSYLDHLKGKRKTTGHSLAKDLKVARQEPYWQNIK